LQQTVKDISTVNYILSSQGEHNIFVNAFIIQPGSVISQAQNHVNRWELAIFNNDWYVTAVKGRKNFYLKPGFTLKNFSVLSTYRGKP
jgi:hypothetical protein